MKADLRQNLKLGKRDGVSILWWILYSWILSESLPCGLPFILPSYYVLKFRSACLYQDLKAYAALKHPVYSHLLSSYSQLHKKILAGDARCICAEQISLTGGSAAGRPLRQPDPSSGFVIYFTWESFKEIPYWIFGVKKPNRWMPL